MSEVEQIVKDLEAVERYEATAMATLPRVKRYLRERLADIRAAERRTGSPPGLPCSSEAQFNEMREAGPDVDVEHLVQPAEAVKSSEMIPQREIERIERGGE